MKWGTDLLDLAMRFQRADGITDTWNVLKDGLGRLGVTDAGYAFFPQGVTAPQGMLAHFDYPQSVLDRYDEMGHAEHDYSVLHCLREAEALCVSTDPRHLSRMTARQKAVEHDFYDVGVRHVVTMPLRGAGLGVGGLTMAFRRTTETEFHGVLKNSEHELRGLGLLFHGAIRRQPGLGGLVTLTDRERETLTWVAAGYSAKVIAHKMSLANRTVEHHIASAQKRLGAINSANAVAKALVLGLMEP